MPNLLERNHPTIPATTQLTQIHISGTLYLIRSPTGQCGEWVSVDDVWYRRLDANAFLLLRDRVNSAIDGGNISAECMEAADRLGRIAEIGIESGCFTSDEIADYQHAPGWFAFQSGCPKWADEY